MKHYLLLSLVLILLSPCGAGNLPKPVIIDTDGGIDDMRALVMMLAAPDIRILAITASCGVLSADETFVKVKSLCRALERNDVPAGTCRDDRCTPAEFALPREYRWGPETAPRGDSAPDGLDMIRSVLAVEDRPTFICLGSLTTARTALRNIASFKSKVKEIVWSAHGARDTTGFNCRIDTAAARFVMQQAVPVRIVKQYDIGSGCFFNDGLLSSIDSIDTPHARILRHLFKSEQVKKHPFAFRATDEMVALYLTFHASFSTAAEGNIIECTPSDSAGLMQGCVEMLKAAPGIRTRR